MQCNEQMTEDRFIADDALLLAEAESDPQSFRELYDRYAERLYAYFLRRTGDRHAALDLTAETFARAWMGRAEFRDEAGGSAAPWLYGIARNLLLMSVRKGRIEREAMEKIGLASRLDSPLASASPSPEWESGADELLDGLPESQREAVRLRVVEELSYEQVASQLETSERAARVRVHRGLAALRKRLITPKETP